MPRQLLLLALTLQLSAQTPPLTLRDAVQKALDQHPSIQAAHAQTKAVAARTAQARHRPDGRRDRLARPLAHDHPQRLLHDQQPQKKFPMTIDRYLLLIAGAPIVLSLALAHYSDPRWLYFTAFIGLNLFQSAFTNWCPMITFLRKLGVRATAPTPRS